MVHDSMIEPSYIIEQTHQNLVFFTTIIPFFKQVGFHPLKDA
jgi:hypothetical protein